MAKPTFYDYRNLDVITNNSYEAIIVDIPGASGLEKDLVIRCTGFSIPGVQQPKIQVDVQNFRFFNSAGNSLFGGNFTISYFEDSAGRVTQAFRAWKENTGGTKSGLSTGGKSAYSRDIILRIYNPSGTVAIEKTMVGCFPETLPEYTTESTPTPNATILQVTLSYDYELQAGVENL